MTGNAAPAILIGHTRDGVNRSINVFAYEDSDAEPPFIEIVVTTIPDDTGQPEPPSQTTIRISPAGAVRVATGLLKAAELLGAMNFVLDDEAALLREMDAH